MNREQSRALKKKGYSQKVIMSRYRQEAIDQGFSEGIKHTYKAVITILFYVIKNHLRISKENYQSLFLRCMSNIESFKTGQLRPSDIDLMKQEILEEKSLDLGKIDR